MEAHRFGGLHRHCSASGADPDNFVLEVERDVTLISGFNGAGKTALQNVVIWCLTGKALRSQHMPDAVHEPMEVYRTGGSDDDPKGSGFELALPPVVPIPSAADLEVLQDRPRIDTWARLTFHDEESADICVVRRELTLGTRGKIRMIVTGLEDLEVSALAIEAGTLMPGIAANMRFDEKTTFAQAIAQLTGLKPLEDLGRRSARVVRRLRNDERKKTEAELAAKLVDFKRKQQSIYDAWSAQADLGEPTDLITPDEDAEQDQCKKSIGDTRGLLAQQKQALERTAERVLGQPLQLAAGPDVASMLKQLSTVSDLLKPAGLNGLPSVATIKNLAAISDDDCRTAESLIADMVARAEAISERLRNKQESARWQLYTRVATWHREHHQDAGIENCPVCGVDLNEVPPDAVLNKDVMEALRLCGEANADAAKGAEEWQRDATREFLETLPKSLRVFVDNPPVNDLLRIYHKAYVEELLADRAFGGHLQALRENAQVVWGLAVESNPLPDLRHSGPSSWPKEFTQGRLAKQSENIARAINLARHRATCTDAIKGIVQRYIGTSSQLEYKTEGGEHDVNGNELPVRDQIEALRMCVTNAVPIVSLLRQIDELETNRKEYAALNQRLVRLERAASAMDAFEGFVSLVFQQVSGLIEALDHGTRDWLNKIYSPHYGGGPSYSGFDAAEEKGLGLRAGIGEMQVPAHKIMNASMLRACVWAFVFSLWERVRFRIGGIDCMLLDDPQNHFDPINAENLAAAIPQMPERGMRPLITSNDYRFLAAIRDKLPRQSTGNPSWRALLMNPISSSRLTAGVSPAVEEIYERQRDWQADENNARKAQLFLSTIRLYVENRLWDLLATDPMVMHKPTLSDLIRALRTARNNGERPFDEVPFEVMLSHQALRDTALFCQTINKAHHRPQEVTPYDACQVVEVFGEIDRLLRSCSASYARFMGRLTRDDRELFLTDLPPAPRTAALTGGPIQLLGAVSARSSVNVLAVAGTEHVVDLDDLGEIAFFGVRSLGLGPLALQGQVVLVSLEDEAEDGDPVVALSGEKVYLRRLFEDRRDPSRVVLACDQTGTEEVPPTLILPKARTRLLPVIGVLYDQMTFGGRDEVAAVENCQLLGRDLVAARVTDDSAYPIIRSGDLVLMEAVRNPDAAEIGRLEDRIVVAVTNDGSEGFAYLKRLGREVARGIRILENVGLKGSALAVATSAESSSSDIQPLHRLWRVHGTLRRRKGVKTI